MKFQASTNPNGDLLVIANETVCVAVPKAELKPGKDFIPKLLIPALEKSVCPRLEAPIGELSDADEKALRDAVKKALD